MRMGWQGPVLFACLSGVLGIGVVRAEEHIACETLSTRSLIVQDGSAHILRLVLQNPTQKTVVIDEYHFGANLLSIRAVAKADGHELTTSIPLLSPGVKPVEIRPNKDAVRNVNLDGSLPDLTAVLRESDVEISWKLSLEPNDDCFSQEVLTTFTLHRTR